MSALDAPMSGENCRAELFTESHRDVLKAAVRMYYFNRAN